MRELSFLHKTAAENFQRYHPKYTARPISSPPKTQSNPKAEPGESSKPDPKDKTQPEATLFQTAKAEGRLMPQKETQEKSRKLWEGYGKIAANKNTDKEFAANYKLVPVMQEKTTLSNDEVQWLSGPLRAQPGGILKTFNVHSKMPPPDTRDSGVVYKGRHSSDGIFIDSMYAKKDGKKKSTPYL